MNTILLHPTDILFFRDGRPMGGASSGHGAAWPLPNVINQAFHAALHRAEFHGVHKHAPGRSSSLRDFSEENREENGRFFGSLNTAGPFPVCTNGTAQTWFFPCPADADDSGKPVLLPTALQGPSSLPRPLKYAVVNTRPPSKELPKNWWNDETWNAYLSSSRDDDLAARRQFKSDTDFADTEHTYGIEIAPETGSVVEGQFYSAHYLRLRHGWALGVFSEAWDKDLRCDLVGKLLDGSGNQIITGGQQRVCTAECHTNQRLPIPMGATITGNRVKWILLTPAIWPEIKGSTTNAGLEIQAHYGGWLPNWVDPNTFDVLLKSGDTARRDRESREAWRARVRQEPPLAARLVAAIVPKPVPVTGYATPSPHWDENERGGHKSTHLAVPAGSVYYFECDSPDGAKALAAALNWHGNNASPTSITNRRSTLMGEKGFGLGVCGNWEFTPNPDVTGRLSF